MSSDVDGSYAIPTGKILINYVKTNIEKAENFTKILMAIEKECLLKSPILSRRHRHCFDDKCKEVMKLCKAALTKSNK